MHTYSLCGVIYLGKFHFVARIIDKSSTIWFYDGVSSDALKGRREGKLNETTPHSLIHCGNKKVSLAIYILDKSERINSD